MTTVESGWTWAWTWWGILVALNIVQVLVAFYLFYRSRKSGNNTEDSGYYRLMRTMGLIFVCVALYRSIFVFQLPAAAGPGSTPFLTALSLSAVLPSSPNYPLPD